MPKLFWQRPRFLQVIVILLLLAPSVATFSYVFGNAALTLGNVAGQQVPGHQSLGTWQTEYPDIGYTVHDSAPPAD